MSESSSSMVSTDLRVYSLCALARVDTSHNGRIPVRILRGFPVRTSYRYAVMRM